MPSEIVVLSLSDLESTLKRFLEQAVVAVKKEYSPKREPDEILLNQDEVCTLLHITKPTLNSYVKRSIVPAYKIEGRLLFKQSEVISSLKRINDT